MRRNKPFYNDDFPTEEPPEVDLAKLRKATEDAIQRGKEREKKRLAEVKAKDERQKQKDQLLASHILAAFPDKCEKEAEQGRSHAIIMGLKYSRDYDSPAPNWNDLPYNKLKGPGALVWNYLSLAGLKPTIEYWHDGMGMDSGFNIVVHW
jgi:hypothetical protein